MASTHRLLLKLQFLYDVPSQLNAYISRGEITQAAQLWARTQPLFDRYRQLGVFAGLERDGKVIVSSVEATVWDRWKDPNTDPVEGAECAALLVMLSPERVNELWHLYLEIQTTKLRELCTRLSESFGSSIRPNTTSNNTTTTTTTNGGETNVNNGMKLAQRATRSDRAKSTEEGLSIRHSTRRNSTVQIIEPSEPVRQFNAKYLPIWNSVLTGFLMQFVQPNSNALIYNQQFGSDNNNTQTPGSLKNAPTSLVGLFSHSTSPGQYFHSIISPRKSSFDILYSCLGK